MPPQRSDSPSNEMWKGTMKDRTMPLSSFMQSILGSRSESPVADMTLPLTPDSSPNSERDVLSGAVPEVSDESHSRRREALFPDGEEYMDSERTEDLLLEGLPPRSGHAHTRAVSLPDSHTLQVAAASVSGAMQVHSTSTSSRKLRSRRRSTLKSGHGIVLKKRRRRRKALETSDDDQSITSSSDMSSVPPPRVINNTRRRKSSRRPSTKLDVRWYLWRMGNTTGLVWMLSFFGIVSVTTMYQANVALYRHSKHNLENGPAKVLYRTNVPLRTAQLHRAGLRGVAGGTVQTQKTRPNSGKVDGENSQGVRLISRLAEDARHGIAEKAGVHSKHGKDAKHAGHSHHQDHPHNNDHLEEAKHNQRRPKKKVGMFQLINAFKKKPSVLSSVPELLEMRPNGRVFGDSTPLERVAMPSAVLMHDERPNYEARDRHLYEGRSPESSDRVVYVDPAMNGTPARHRTLELYPSDYTDPTQLYPILDSSDERIRLMEPRDPYVQGECVPMQQWQTTYNPSCNRVHELSIDHVLSAPESGDMNLFGTRGFWRNAWRVELPVVYNRNHETSQDKFVMKTLKLEHNFEEAHFEHDRIDAVAMERLTSSPHVIDVFGFCGHTVMTEFADGKRLGQLADMAKKKPLERLRIARDISEGLADVHGIDGDGNVTFVHLDINPANVVSIGGRLKLNDFNIGIPRKWNTTSNTACGFPTQYPNPQWRSPEEARGEQNLTEKVDIFSFGHILFRLISGHEPWNKFEVRRPTKEDLTNKVARGVMPSIPVDVLESKDPEVQSILRMMIRCYSLNPEDRPTARQIFVAFDAALKRAEAGMVSR